MGCGASNNAAVPTATPTRPAAPRAAPATIVTRPLMATKSYKHGSPITQREINKLRTDFWATRTDGNAHMWQAIRTSAEALLANDVSLANAIIEASNVTTPNGSLEVCYDERGYQYKVPQYCVSNPQELIAGSDPSPNAVIPADSKSNKTGSSKSTNNAPVTIKIRINPGDHNLTVKADATNTIHELKTIITVTGKQANIPISLASMDPALQRMIFMGRELKDTMKISEVGIDESKVVQVFLRPFKK